MAKCNYNTKFELTWLFGFFTLLCHSVSADGKVIICNFLGHGKPSKARVSCEHRPIQGYKTR